MESVVEVPPKKPKSRQNLNIHVAECIRQFELPQQYPSIVPGLRSSKTGSEKNMATIQKKSVQNIISALPLSGKMKFIPNKEVSISENLQKLKLKLPDGRDLGEVKFVVPGQDEKLQTKIVTMSKISQKSEKPITWTIKSQSSGKATKPKIKTVTRMINGSLASDERLKESDKSIPPKMTVQILNGNHDYSRNVIQDNNKPVLTNLKRISSGDECESNKQKIIVQKTDSDILKKFIIENQNMIIDEPNGESKVFTLKQYPGSKKVIMMQKDNQLLKSIGDKPISLKPITQSSLNNHNIAKNFEKIIFKSSLNGSIIRKRDGSFLEHSNSHESKQARLELILDDSKHQENHGIELLDYEPSNSPKPTDTLKETPNIAPRKNIMVFVPNEATDEKKITSNSFNTEEVPENDDNSAFVSDNEMVHEEHKLDENLINKKSKSIDISKPDNSNKTTINKNARSQDLLDKFDILKKAVLSVQDANLRAEALKALKDCGIKVKKTIPMKRPVATKVINESSTQTEIFSLLKNGEFIYITEDTEELIKIKQTRKIMKQPINTLSTNKETNKVYSESNQIKFQIDLDNVLEKVFPGNKGIMDVKEAFVQNRITQAKIILSQLKKDFEAAKSYDNDGLLGIHRAVMDDNMQGVQKHMLILKAAKQSIDICTEDDKTSLELAVEYEVNPQIIKILLDAGAQPVSSKPIHDSAVIIAAKTSSKVLPLLLKYINRNNRPLLNAKNSEGLAAIHYCAQFGNLEGITELLKHGVEVNLQEERSGRTALFYAVETKSKDVPQETYNEICHKLLEYGAISNIPIFSKHSVLSLIDDVKSHSLKIALNKAVK